jgi:hypothetical protein
MAGATITAGFIGLLVWLSLSAQTTQCRVCVAYGGGRNCAIASAASTKEAARSAHTTACGTLAHGMNDAIACQNTTPMTESCRTR